VLESAANGGHVPVAPREIGANQRAEREQMRAIHRFGELSLAGALALAPSTALAQQAPPPSDAPPADAVGPKELQNFTLNGTVTRPADQPAAVQPASPKRAPRSEAQAPAQPAATRQSATAPAPSPAPRRTAAAPSEPLPQRASTAPEPEPLRQSMPSSSVTVALPKLAGGADAATAAESTSAPTFAPPPQTTGALAPDRKLAILPWLLAALALGAGAAFLFWRNRGREAFAGGPQIDAFTAPTPAPVQPRPIPAPAPKAPLAEPAGIVSTRLRPWLEIGFKPLRCILEDQHLIVEFELELFNSGSAPARSVLVEGSLFNAGNMQDAELGAFFENPVAEGERISAIPPLKRASLKTRVLLPRERLAAYEMAGRQVFIPLIAFNALYSWGGGAGQTSVGYLLGRDTSGDKVGPFRLDLGPRIFRGIGARLLPTGVRR
jgi:hypothetical protein